MDLLQTVLQNEFTWGLSVGILVAGFIWKSGFTARRRLYSQLNSLEGELKTLQNHLNTQLKITASGNESLQVELDSLRKQNETLRVNQAALQQKPGRAELRLLHVQEVAIRAMREQAPGFASVWEKAIRQGEQEVGAAESGFSKLMRRVIPSLGASTTSQTTLISSDDQGDQSK